MAISAGARLKIIREKLGLPREKFSELTGVGYLRLVTIENEKGRMSTDDLELVAKLFPELLHWLILGTAVKVETFEQSESLYLKKLALTLKLEGKDVLEEVL